MSINQIYKKLLSFFNFYFPQNTVRTEKETPTTADEYIGALMFKITKNKDIDILCSLPDLKNKTTQEIQDLSETFAQFLLYVNEGYLKDDIIAIIQKDSNYPGYSNDEDRAKNCLFIDNVMFYWATIHVENYKKRTSKENDQPLIKPTAVFNQ